MKYPSLLTADWYHVEEALLVAYELELQPLSSLVGIAI
jgi:hypothetical protein